MRGTLLKGAKKVPKGTLFFIGQNGQLYMRTGSLSRGRRQDSCSGLIEEVFLPSPHVKGERERSRSPPN